MRALVVAMALAGSAARGQLQPASEQAGYWASGKARPFASGTFSVGPLSRVVMALGYGQPHWLWGGVEVQGLVATEFAAAYAGLRLELLGVNAILGLRQTVAYARVMPPVATAYDDAALFDPRGSRSSTVVVDASLWGYVPLGPTLTYWEASVMHVPWVPEGLASYDEYLRFTINERLGGIVRVQPMLRLLEDRLLVGPIGEVAWALGRAPLWRVGGGVTVVITRHLSAQAALTVPLAGPDGLSLFNQVWGLTRVTYAWATEEPRPGLE